MRVGDMREKVVDDVVIQSAANDVCRPASGGIIRCCGKDVLYEIQFVFGFGELVDFKQMGGLNDPGSNQTHDEVRDEECEDDLAEGIPQNDSRQDDHVYQVENLTPNDRDILAQRNFGIVDVLVVLEEKVLEVLDENKVQGCHRIHEKDINMLKPVHLFQGGIRRKTENAMGINPFIFPMHIHDGVVANVVHDPPHIRTDAAGIQDVAQDFVYQTAFGNGIVVGIVCDVHKHVNLCQPLEDIHQKELPIIGFKGIKQGVTPDPPHQSDGDFKRHLPVRFSGAVVLIEKIIQTFKQNFLERFVVPAAGRRFHCEFRFNFSPGKWAFCLF
jgi:hypothetical protein